MMESIYPKRGPAVAGIAEQMNEAAGSLSVFKDFPWNVAEVNAETTSDIRQNVCDFA